MTSQLAPAPAPGRDAGAGTARPPAALLRRARDLAGVVPFAAYVTAGLLLPMIAIAFEAFRNPDTGRFTWSNVHVATHGIYLHSFVISIELSVVASIVPGIAGFLIAYAIFTARHGSVLRAVAITASGVFANFRWLTDLGFNPYSNGFNLYGLGGVALCYMYFQIPLMILVILPAFEGLRPAWREAAQNIGARSWQYWRYVGGPVLAPSVLGSMLLLFGSAFSAYATAEALTSGSIPLTSIEIGSFLNGNVLAGQQNVGFALGLGMVVIIAVVMLAYTIMQRRAARWLQ